MTVLRTWSRNPRWTVAVLACLAISVAGGGTVLTFAWGLLLRPLPFPESSRLVMIEPRPQGAGDRPYLSYPNFADLRGRLATFEKLEGAMVSRLVVDTPAGSERLRGETVTPGYFELLGLTPSRGRAFAPDEYEGRGPNVLLLSTRVWRSHFGGDPAVVGRTLVTRAGPRTVVGVMPDGYLGIAESDGTDVWLPEKQSNHPAFLNDRSTKSVLAIGRLRRGASPDAATAELASALSVLATEHPDANRGLGGVVRTLADYWRASLRDGVRWLLVGASFLLLIGCLNVAFLLLARLVPIEREMALRLSLGATRRRIVLERLVESGFLSLLGGAIGVFGSLALLKAFGDAGRFALPIHLPVEFGLGPLALCLGLVVLAGVASGLAPALIAGRASAALALRSASRGVVASALGGRTGPLVVALQTALAFAVLVGAGLFLQSYERLRFADFGYRTEGLLRYQVSLQPEQHANPEALHAFWDSLAADLRALPGVKGVGAMTPTLPPWSPDAVTLTLRGEALATPTGALDANLRLATSDAFSIFGVELRSGRMFEATDRRGTQAVALVSETLARALGGRAEGRTIAVDFDGPQGEVPLEAQVIGVVGDARWYGQADRAPSGNDVFLSLVQFPRPSVGFVFDAAGDPRALVEPVRRAVLRRDPTAALHWIDTMDEALDYQTASERFWALLASAYGAAAFGLAAIGLYGILSYAVSSRQREIGLRMALGAAPAAVRRATVLHGLRPTAAGIAGGALLGLAGGRLVESRLHGVTATDPLAYGVAAAFVLAFACLAALVPAIRASRVAPMEALRSE